MQNRERWDSQTKYQLDQLLHRLQIAFKVICQAAIIVEDIYARLNQLINWDLYFLTPMVFIQQFFVY